MKTSFCRKFAKTLVELLVVLSIISLLLGMYLIGIAKAWSAIMGFLEKISK